MSKAIINNYIRINKNYIESKVTTDKNGNKIIYDYRKMFAWRGQKFKMSEIKKKLDVHLKSLSDQLVGSQCRMILDNLRRELMANGDIDTDELEEIHQLSEKLKAIILTQPIRGSQFRDALPIFYNSSPEEVKEALLAAIDKLSSTFNVFNKLIEIVNKTKNFKLTPESFSEVISNLEDQ